MVKYNTEKVLFYALVHDLVEVYAGDTPVFSPSKDLHTSKAQREKEAYSKIRTQFSDTDLHKFIYSYEHRVDKESKLVYSVDKVLPLLANVFDSGRQMQKEGITPRRMILQKNANKVSESPIVSQYFNHLIAQLMKYV